MLEQGVRGGWWSRRTGHFQVTSLSSQSGHRRTSSPAPGPPSGDQTGRCRCCCCPGWCRDCPPLGWALVSLGALMVITAFLLGVTYFSIRTLTTSLEHVETVPAYATALLVCCSGILLMFLYKSQEPINILPTLVLCGVCVVLTVTSTVTLSSRVITTMHRFTWCQYSNHLTQCRCYVVNKEEVWSETEYIYGGSASCGVVTGSLYQLICVQCGLYAGAILLSLGGTLIVIHVLRNYKKGIPYRAQRDTDSDDGSLLEADPGDGDGRMIALPGGLARLRDVSHLRPSHGCGHHWSEGNTGTGRECACSCHRHQNGEINDRTECGVCCSGAVPPRCNENIHCRRCRRFGGRGCRRHRHRGRQCHHSVRCRCPACASHGLPWIIPMPPPPTGPPPPYNSSCLPPYIEDDLVPDYRSTVSSQEPAPDYRSTLSSPEPPPDYRSTVSSLSSHISVRSRVSVLAHRADDGSSEQEGQVNTRAAATGQISAIQEIPNSQPGGQTRHNSIPNTQLGSSANITEQTESSLESSTRRRHSAH